MKHLIFVIIIFLTLCGSVYSQNAYVDYNVTVQEHWHSERTVAIFHDITSAKHWADEFKGEVIPGPNATFYVIYTETYWGSTPNDWKDN